MKIKANVHVQYLPQTLLQATSGVVGYGVSSWHLEQSTLGL